MRRSHPEEERSWTSTRKVVLEHDGYECVFCGMNNEEHEEERGRELDVHHIVPRKAGGVDEPYNLISVCIDCHSTLERTQGRALWELTERWSDVPDEIDKKIANNITDELVDTVADELIGVDEELIEEIITDKVESQLDGAIENIVREEVNDALEDIEIPEPEVDNFRMGRYVANAAEEAVRDELQQWSVHR